jgi:hypothetical protein
MVSEYVSYRPADQLPLKRSFSFAQEPRTPALCRNNPEVAATGAKQPKPSQDIDYMSRYGKWLESQLEDHGMQLDTELWKV